MMNLYFILFVCLISGPVFSQHNPAGIEFSKLLKYKVDADRFEFGWLPTAFKVTPCFRDFTKNTIQSNLVDRKKNAVIYTSTDPEINGLKIITSKITLNKESRVFEIDGQITGAWASVIPSEFEIYIGHRKDTISEITLSPNLHGTIYYNGVKVNTTIVVDRVPAFYLSNFKKFDAYRGTKNLADTGYKEMLFTISSVIDEYSVLIFGLSSRYAEIFEIGKLLTQ